MLLVSVFLVDWDRTHTERENSAVVLVHQRRVRVLDLVNVVEVLLSDNDLVGDVTSDG